MRNPTVIGAGAYGGAGGTVIDNPTPVYSLQVGTIDVTEGSPVSFTVARAGGLGLAGGVDWALTAGTPADFGGSLPSGHATFAVGATAFAVSLPTSGNSIVDNTRPFTVSLSNPASGGALGSPSSITGTVADDDTAVANSWTLFPDWTVNAKSHTDSGPATPAGAPATPFSTAAAFNIRAAGIATHANSTTWVSRLLQNTEFLAEFQDFTFPVYRASTATTTRTIHTLNPTWHNSVAEGATIPWNPGWTPTGGFWNGSGNTDAQLIILFDVASGGFAQGSEIDIWRAIDNSPSAGTLTCSSIVTTPQNYVTGDGRSEVSRGSGIANLAMLATAAEAQAGLFKHALCMSIPNVEKTTAPVFLAPAIKSDGPSNGQSPGVPEGTRFVLTMTDAAMDTFIAGLAGSASIPAGMKAVAKAAMQAMRDYGFIISDHGGGWNATAGTGTGAHFYFEDRNSGASIWSTLGCGSDVSAGGRSYPHDLFRGLFTTSNLRVLVDSTAYAPVDVPPTTWPLVPSVTYAQATLNGSASVYLSSRDQHTSTRLGNGNVLVGWGDGVSPAQTMGFHEISGTPPAGLTATARAGFVTPPNLKPNTLLSVNAKYANNVVGFYVDQTADARNSSRVMTSTDNGATFALRTEQVFLLGSADRLQVIGQLQLGPGYDGGGYTGLSTDFAYVYLGRVGNMATLYQAGADGSVYLSRVQIAGSGGALANLWDRTKYTFFNGEDINGAPTWTATAPGAKVLPTPDIGKQFQVYWVPAPHNRFFGACFTSGTNLLIAESRTPWGPWSRVFSGAGSDPDWTLCFTASTPAGWFGATECYVMASGNPPDDLEVQRVPLTALP